MGTNDDSRPRPLKEILSCELDIEILLSRKRKVASFVPYIFFAEIVFPTRTLEVSCAEGKNSTLVQSVQGESCHTGWQDYITPHETEIISMAGAIWAIRLPKLVAYQKLLALHANVCSLAPKLVKLKKLPTEWQTRRRRCPLCSVRMLPHCFSLDFSTHSAFVEVVTCPMPHPYQLLTALGVYRSPTSPEADDEKIIHAVRLVANQTRICLILGHLNAPHINCQAGLC